MNNIKGLVGAAAAVVVFGFVVIIARVGGDDPSPGTREPGPAPSSTVSLDDPNEPTTGADPTSAATSAKPTPSSTNLPDDPGGDRRGPEAAAEVAQRAVETFHSASYKDSGANEWIKRLGAFSTVSFKGVLAHEYAAEPGDSYWGDVVVKDQRRMWADVDAINVSGLHKQRKDLVVYTVEYTLFVGTGASDEDPQKVDTALFVAVKKTGGKWLVHGMKLLSDRSGF